MIKQQELDAFRRNILPGYVEFVEKQNEMKRVIQPSKPVKKIKPTEQVKRCRICGKFKKLSDFYKNPLKKFGRFDECKECIKERRQQNVDRKRKAGVKASMSA